MRRGCGWLGRAGRGRRRTRRRSGGSHAVWSRPTGTARARGPGGRGARRGRRLWRAPDGEAPAVGDQR
uniref:Uncharacterized protein n=1 Tax=Arundo donax TaxID=35708 RepID=A0A0A9HSE1_ARUDO